MTPKVLMTASIAHDCGQIGRVSSNIFVIKLDR